MVIRLEHIENIAERSLIRAINQAAFGRPDEADLVDKLRADGNALLSLVAELDAGLVGHVLFSRMWITEPDRGAGPGSCVGACGRPSRASA